ncbi:hypothetical protein LRP50_25195 [Enterovibrio sp. ZSDZ42]|uniref:Uncharacterized protein n=1 Tax=Enterovibrio gelatinilyticus TaxID=2899819 RepID=A0ABT5R814_9GAMM|nr:hypothetical protein [Enterovibrio sp. ZSDZ42]MDD1796416.1 hypothetical protein [Enterovibrio sp. ZSDZ42]
MIKVEYTLDGQSDGFELSALNDIDSLEFAHGQERISDNLAYELLMGAVSHLELNCNCEEFRDTPKDLALKLGFTKLLGFFEDKVIFVISA